MRRSLRSPEPRSGPPSGTADRCPTRWTWPHWRPASSVLPLSAWAKNRPVPKNTQILLSLSALTVAAEVIGPTFVVPEHGVGEQAKLASRTVGTRLEPLKMPQLLKVSGWVPLTAVVANRYILPLWLGVGVLF